MNNDNNYLLLSSLTPSPAVEDIIGLLIKINFKTVKNLSNHILKSQPSISRVLLGDNLPAVRREIIKALGLSFDPWAGIPSDSIVANTERNDNKLNLRSFE